VTRRLEIVVGELVVRGLPPAAARAAAASFEARLTELANSEGSIPARAEHSRRLPGIDAPTDHVGEAVADAVWGVLAGGTAR
jgi:hypothetical protein